MFNLKLDNKYFEKSCFIYFRDGTTIKGTIIGFSLFIISPDWIKVRTKNSLIHVNTDFIKTITYHD